MGPTVEVYRGNTKSFTVSVFTAKNVPFSLNGYDCTFLVSKFLIRSVKLIEKDILPENITENIITVNLTSEALTREIGNYYYEVIVSKDGSTFKKTVAQGIFCILPSIDI